MKYGKLLILSMAKDNKHRVDCLCECGKKTRANIYNLKSGNTTSCGCARKQIMAQEASKRFTNKKPVNATDWTGRKIGLVTVIERVKDRRIHTTTYKLRCECGTEFEQEISTLRRSRYETCTCGYLQHPLKLILQSMIDRCEDASIASYKWYGAKGIRVCDQWRKFPIKFIDWALANGWKPCKKMPRNEILTIDRIDSSKDYCPENCQWITLSENSKKAMQERWNRHRNHYQEMDN